LGHASSVHSLHLSVGVVGTVMKALFAGEAKWAVDPVRNLPE